MKTTEGQHYIQELTEALRNLRIAQNRVNNIINRIRENENNSGNAADQGKTQQRDQHQGAQDTREVARLPVAEVVEDTERIPETTLRVGDTVRIINPTRGQPNTGIITGYQVTRTFIWITVTPRQGKPMKRRAKNLHRV